MLYEVITTPAAPPSPAVLRPSSAEPPRRAAAEPSPRPASAEPGGDAESVLARYGRDLTLLAREGRLDPVVGRDDEIRRVIQVLSRRSKNNPALIGEPRNNFV